MEEKIMETIGVIGYIFVLFVDLFTILWSGSVGV